MKQRLATSILDFFRALLSTPIGLIAVLSLTFCLRILYFEQIIDGDVGNLGYMAWRMAGGEILIDLEGPGKPPLYVMLYAVFIRFFGTSILGLKIFGTFFVLMAVLAVYWLANRAYGKRIGLLAALLFGVFSSGPMVEGGTVNLETLLHLPYILAIGFFVKASTSGRIRWYFISGLCAALTTLVKQVGGVLFFVFFCYGIYEGLRKPVPLSKKRWFCRYLFLGGGALLPVIGLITFYHFQGYTLDQLYTSMLGSNFHYIQRGYEYTSLLKNFFSSLKIILQENGLLWLGTLFTSAHLGWRIWRGQGEVNDRILLWWVFWSFLILLISGTFYRHYFLQLIAPFSILTAYAIVTTWKSAKSFSPQVGSVVKGVWTLVLGLAMIFFIKTDYLYFFYYTPVEQTIYQHKGSDGTFDGYGLYNVVQQEIANYIRAHTDPAESIYVWGIAPQVYFLAQRRAATQYRNNYNMSQLFTNNWRKELQTYASIVMDEIKKSYPAYIVQIFRLEDFPELQTFVQNHYTLDKNIAFLLPLYNVRLYRRCPDIEPIPKPK